MKRKAWAGVLVVAAITYALVFVRLPSPQYNSPQSTYIAHCSSVINGHQFTDFSFTLPDLNGQNIGTTKIIASKDPVFSITDKDLDILVKLLCANKGVPSEGFDAFWAANKKDPNFDLVGAGKPNYWIDKHDLVFSPSYGELAAHMIFLVGMLGVAWAVGRKG